MEKWDNIEKYNNKTWIILINQINYEVNILKVQLYYIYNFKFAIIYYILTNLILM